MIQALITGDSCRQYSCQGTGYYKCSLCYVVRSNLLTTLTDNLALTLEDRCLVKYHKVEWWPQHALRGWFKAVVMCCILFSIDTRKAFSQGNSFQSVHESVFQSVTCFSHVPTQQYWSGILHSIKITVQQLYSYCAFSLTPCTTPACFSSFQFQYGPYSSCVLDLLLAICTFPKSILCANFMAHVNVLALLQFSLYQLLQHVCIYTRVCIYFDC